MPTFHSNLYARVNDSRSYAGPTATGGGELIVRHCTYTGTIPATSDILKLAGGFAEGEKLLRFTLVRSGDADTDNDLTINLGWASAPTRFLSASTGAQATAAITIAADVALPLGGAVKNDELQLTVQAGEAEASVTWTILIESYIPQAA